MLKSLMSGVSIEAECLNAVSPASTRPTGFASFLVLDIREEPRERDRPNGRVALGGVPCALRLSGNCLKKLSTGNSQKLALLAHPKAPADTRSTGAVGSGSE